jgi:hypothetical protein
MSGNTITVIILAIVAFGVLLWVLHHLHQQPRTGEASASLAIESFLPRHYGYFPQVRQALSSVDGEYLDRTASREVAETAHRERRGVARHFLAGLLEDFSNLERLARMVAALSPVISREQETERLVLGLQFRVLYAWVWLSLSTGHIHLGQIEHLTGLVGRLATRMEQAMAAVGALSVPELNSNLHA